MRKYFGKPELLKATNSLSGILKGILADSSVNKIETNYLNEWLKRNSYFEKKKPLDKIFKRLRLILADARIDQNELIELEEILAWVSNEENGFFTEVSKEIQFVLGIVEGIVCDRELNELEVKYLMDGLAKKQNIFPFGEIKSVVASIGKNSGKKEIDAAISYLSQFSIIGGQSTVDPLKLMSDVKGVCAFDPEIHFEGKTFCFTGESDRYTRKNLIQFVEELGGSFSKNVTQKTDFLIVCADGSGFWAFEAYGQKVAKAMELRKAGSRIVLIHEYDFLDAVEDKKSAA